MSLFIAVTSFLHAIIEFKECQSIPDSLVANLSYRI